MGYPRYTRSYCIHLYWLDFLLLSRIGDGWIPHKTSDVGVPQQHHETVCESPPEEDGDETKTNFMPLIVHFQIKHIF